MSDNVVQLQETKLDRLAERIKGDIARRDTSKTEWVEATVDLCLALAEARAEFKDDQSFGRWFAESGFQLNDHDRAAAIAMGQNIEQARLVLEATERRSLQLIHREECRFANASKPTRGASSIGKGKKTRIVVDEIVRRTASGQSTKVLDLAKDLGVSKGVIEKALTIHATEARAVDQPLPDFGLSATAQQKLEVAIAAHKKRLEREFEDRVRQEAMKWIDEVRIPLYEKKLAEIERMLSWPRNAVMTAPEYRKVMICLHPDSLHSRTEEQLAEAFRIFTHYKPKMVLLNDEERQRTLSDLPRTREEMLARKRTKR